MASRPKTAKGVIGAAGRAAVDLDSTGRPFALVGGLAVAARGDPRFTRDVDLAVSCADDRDAESLVHALAARGYRVDTVVEQARRGRLATARLVHRADTSVYVDLLFASSGIEPEIADLADRILLAGGVTVPIARVGHLIALKLLSESDRRLQDRIDLSSLARVATDADWDLALEAVRLIRKRGFHRGRSLRRGLAALRGSVARR